MKTEQGVYRAFKMRLTMRVNRKDWQGVIDLWREFETYKWSRGLPDDWRRWERAAEDAAYQLQLMRSKSW